MRLSCEYMHRLRLKKIIFSLCKKKSTPSIRTKHIHTHVRTYVHTQHTHTHTWCSKQNSIDTPLGQYNHVRKHAYIRVRSCTCVHAYMSIQTYTFVRVCVCEHTQTYTCVIVVNFADMMKLVDQRHVPLWQDDFGRQEWGTENHCQYANES